MSKAFDVLRRSRRLVLLMGIVALLASGFLVSQPPDALAATLRPLVCTYYSDGTYTTIVGRILYRCNGTISERSGTTSSFPICESEYCCGNFWC